MGGQSAFGTKAGDTFTKVTIYVATFWILLCVVAIKMLNTPSDEFGKVTPDGGVGAPAVPGKQDGGSEEGEKGPADSSGIGEASQDGDGEQP
jgi:preprotein translocase subunit SecG